MAKSDEKGNLFLFPMTGEGQEATSDSSWRDVSHLYDFNPVSLPSFCAVDFETYYSQKYSLTKMSEYEYVHNPAFDAYLVALEWWNGNQFLRWVGHPSKAPWSDINGIQWVSHNAAFDEACYRRSQKIGDIQSNSKSTSWDCTADLSTYLQAGRNLKLAVHNFFDVDISKDVRDRMKTGDVTDAEIRDYAADDSYWSAKIWIFQSPKWSEQERSLSRLTRYQGWRGIAVNTKEVREGIVNIERVKNRIQRELPWGHKGAPTSIKLFTAECHKQGIFAPTSLAEESSSAERWEKAHGKEFPWIKLIKRYTKAHQTQGSLKLLEERMRGDNTVPFTLLYCKAHTKRWQHAKGLRMQNLDTQPVEGIHLRHMLVPRPNHVFVIADLNQIEPRILNWRAGNYEFLELCKKGISPYEAHARSSMGYTSDKPLKDENPQIYKLAKARTLALGYQAAAERFKEMAKAMAGLEVSLNDQTIIINGQNVLGKELSKFLSNSTPKVVRAYQRGEFDVIPSAAAAVQDFRDNSKEITALWKNRQEAVAARRGGHYKLSIGNGSAIRYFDVEVEEKTRYNREGKSYRADQITGYVVKNSPNPKDKKYLYGGSIVENEIQWIAREVFAYCYHQTSLISDVFPVFSAHDEGIWEVHESVAEQRLQDIQNLMSTAPPWASEVPIDSDAEIATHYKK